MALWRDIAGLPGHGVTPRALLVQAGQRVQHLLEAPHQALYLGALGVAGPLVAWSDSESAEAPEPPPHWLHEVMRSGTPRIEDLAFRPETASSTAIKQAGLVAVTLPVAIGQGAQALLLWRPVLLTGSHQVLLDLLAAVQVQLQVQVQQLQMSTPVSSQTKLTKGGETQAQSGSVGSVRALSDRALAAAPGQRQATVAGAGADEEATPVSLDLQAVFDKLPVSIFLLDSTDLRMLSVNRCARREFNLADESTRGLTLGEVFGAQVHDSVDAVVSSLLVGGGAVEHDYELLVGGRRRIVNAQHMAMSLGSEAPPAIVIVARDVTAQRDAERDLQESEARFREFAETMEDIFFVTNPHRTEFHFLSNRPSDGWNSSRDSLISGSKQFMESMYPVDRAQLAVRLRAELQLEPTDIRYRAQHPQRGERWLRVRTRSRRLPQGDIRVYGAVSDVTDEQLRQQELKAARDAAESASQAKSQFLASMSHEIRTPMNGVLGMTELLLGTPLTEQQRRFAQAVYRSGESLLEIINDILDFSKIEAGRMALAHGEFELRGVIEDTLELLAPRAHEKGLELSFRAADGLPAMVHGDSLRLRQVLTSLIANAVKFTERGEVVVSLAPAPEAGEGFFEFAVTDSGIGIDPAVLPNLFEAFTQGSTGMARRFGGTGLGLTISKRLIELMGGRLTVHSQPGVGSRFSCLLPLGRAQDDDPVEPLEALPLPPLRVLVVDDNQTNRQVLVNLLQTWGLQVVGADGANQAIDVLSAANAHFDLALVDKQMPGLDGLGFAQVRRRTGLHPAMKMILLASGATPDEVRAAHEAGYERLIPKPVRRTELREALLQVCTGHAYTQQLTPQLNSLILVVEDNAVNQEVIGQMLRALGCRVRVCPGGLAGLRALCEQRFDLVLMDIQMPGMDGVEALQWFRKGETSRFQFITPTETPVIAVTANALEGDRQRFLELGFDGYLCKPFRQSQLLAMLMSHLRTSVAPSTPMAAPLSDAMPQAGGQGAEVQVLDPQALDQLRKLDPSGENRLMERLVSAFDASVARLMPQLQLATQNGEMGGIRHVSHTLKSSSASIGAVKLSKLCAEIEAMARQEQSDGLAERVALLQAEVEIVRVALKQLLNG